MNRLLLTLLVSPTLFGSVMSLSAIAQNAQSIGETPAQSADAPRCVRSPHTQRLSCMRLPAKTAANPKQTIGWQSPDGQPVAMMDFTEEESDAAVALYGCDCPVCMNSLRQLRGLPPLQAG